MKKVWGRFNRKHLYLFLGFYLAFAGFTFFVLSRQTESDWRENWNALATVGVISGPFTGAVARHFQSCCTEFSWALFPYCAVFLAGGILFQFAPVSQGSHKGFFHLLMWGLGLLGWFGGAVISFGHALS